MWCSLACLFCGLLSLARAHNIIISTRRPEIAFSINFFQFFFSAHIHVNHGAFSINKLVNWIWFGPATTPTKWNWNFRTKVEVIKIHETRCWQTWRLKSFNVEKLINDEKLRPSIMSVGPWPREQAAHDDKFEVHERWMTFWARARCWGERYRYQVVMR